MSYTRVNWQNAPSTATPVNAENLNTMDKGIADAHSQLASIAVNVKTFGAKGDGVTDDYQSIQNALDSLGTDGGLVYIPKGTYLLSKPITIKNNVWIEGNSKYSTLLKRTGHATSPILGVGGEQIDAIIYVVNSDSSSQVTNISIKNMSLLGSEQNVLNMTKYGIYSPTFNQSHIEEVRIDYVDTGLFSNSYVWNTTLKNIRVNICHTGFAIHSSTSLFMLGCYVSNYRDYGYYCNNWLYSHMSNNASDSGGNRTYWTDDSNLAVGYYFRICKGVKITACGSEGTNGTPLYLDSCEYMSIDSCNHFSIYSDYVGTSPANYVCAYRISNGKNIELNKCKFEFQTPAFTGVGSANTYHYNRYVTGIIEGLSIIDTHVINGVWFDSGATSNSVNLSERWLLGNGTADNKDIYVSNTNGDDLTGDGTSQKPFKTMSRAIKILPRVVDHTITFNLADGTYIDAFKISGFMGRGTILIKGASKADVIIRNNSINSITVSENTCSVIFDAVSLYTGASEIAALLVKNNPGIVEVKNSNLDSWSGSYTNTAGIKAEKSPFVLSTNNTSSTAKIGLYAVLGSTIIKNGTQPTGTTANEQTETGGLIR